MTSPKAKDDAAAEEKPATRKAKAKDGAEPCGLCWPDGAPEGHASGSCVHGSWSA